jgi:predicted transposase YdaD
MLIAEFNLATAKRVWKEEGREEGREESRLEISKKLLAMGVPPKQISEASGLPLEVIRALRKKNRPRLYFWPIKIRKA